MQIIRCKQICTLKYNFRSIKYIDVLDFINVEDNKFAFEMYLHGENAYIGNGRIVDVPNAEKYEEMTNIEARKEIEKILYQGKMNNLSVVNTKF